MIDFLIELFTIIRVRFFKCKKIIVLNKDNVSGIIREGQVRTFIISRGNPFIDGVMFRNYKHNKTFNRHFEKVDI